MKNSVSNLSLDELENEMEVLEKTSLKKIQGGKQPDYKLPVGVADGFPNEGKGAPIGAVSGGGGVQSGYTLDGGYHNAGTTPSMDHSSSSNPYGNDSGGGYLVDSATYTSASGDPYYKVSFDNGKTWVNQASSLIGFSLDKFTENLGNYSTLASLGAFAANNPKAEAAFGKLGVFASTFGIGLDATKLYDYYNNNSGNMDGFRFTIKTTGAGAGIIGASYYTGPQGAMVGTVIGVTTMVAEYQYEEIANKLNEMVNSFTNQYGAGGFPQGH